MNNMDLDLKNKQIKIIEEINDYLSLIKEQDLINDQDFIDFLDKLNELSISY